ncbi:MAG: acyltransferase family protein, partial [Deinococcales bacterium]
MIKAATTESSSLVNPARHYDIDWLRTLALALLIIYHVAISFQPWAIYVGFIQNEQPLEFLWPLMSAINIWRIPILFFISGMGLYFAAQRRNWKELLGDRSLRILVPFIFGYFCIGPINAFFISKLYTGKTIYAPGAWHLWFLLNIFIYVLLLLPLVLYVKRQPNHILFRWLARLFRMPLGIFLLAIAIILEAVLLNPQE